MIYKNWEKMGGGNFIYGDTEKFFISYQPNEVGSLARETFGLIDASVDSMSPETAICIVGDMKDGENRTLIFRGDKRKELKKLYPDLEKMKKYWKKHGGHFWSDDLDDE